jgi:hypothetical protein
MQKFQIVPSSIKIVDDYIDMMLSSASLNYVKGGNFYNIYKVFAKLFFDKLKELEALENGYYEPYETYPFLDVMIKDYGLPNAIFPNLSTLQEKLYAITVMKKAQKIQNLDDLEALFVLLGVEVKFRKLKKTPYYNNFGFGRFYESDESKNNLKRIKVHYYVQNYKKSKKLYNNFGFGKFIKNDLIGSPFVKQVLDFLSIDYIVFMEITKENFYEKYE